MSALRDAIVLHLQADSNVIILATGGIFPGLPTKDVSYPFVTVTTQSAPKPERAFRGDGTVASEIVFEGAEYLVKAIDQSTSPKVVSDINTALRVSLDGAAISMTGYELVNLIFAGEVQYDELSNGITYQHEGGIYQIWATKT